MGALQGNSKQHISKQGHFIILSNRMNILHVYRMLNRLITTAIKKCNSFLLTTTNYLVCEEF